jgi:hypothetical protein
MIAKFSATMGRTRQIPSTFTSFISMLPADQFDPEDPFGEPCTLKAWYFTGPLDPDLLPASARTPNTNLDRQRDNPPADGHPVQPPGEPPPNQPQQAQVQTGFRSVPQPPSHPAVVSVCDFLTEPSEVKAGQTGLHSLRALLRWTGQSTLEERRSLSAQWKAFERHQCEVLATLDNPEVFRKARLIVFGNAPHESVKATLDPASLSRSIDHH